MTENIPKSWVLMAAVDIIPASGLGKDQIFYDNRRRSYRTLFSAPEGKKKVN